jgi:hypothetical protein
MSYVQSCVISGACANVFIGGLTEIFTLKNGLLWQHALNQSYQCYNNRK